MYKRIISFILCVFMILLLVPVSSIGFSDISPVKDVVSDVPEASVEKEPDKTLQQYTITVDVRGPQDCDESTPDICDIYPGDVCKVAIYITGGEYMAASFTLTYDTDAFTIDHTPFNDNAEGWTENKDGSFTYYAVSSGETPLNEQVNGSFGFKANDRPGSGTFEFTVDPDTVYVSPMISEQWMTDDNKLSAKDIVSSHIGIICKSMMVNVDAVEGLIYNAESRELVNPSFTAVDTSTGEPIPNASISYCVLTESEVASGCVPSVFTDDIPKRCDAGKYTVYYRVSKEGFATVQSHVNVTIQKARKTLMWSGKGFDMSVTDESEYSFRTTYTDGVSYYPPTARYDDFDNIIKTASVRMISPENGEMNAAGVYIFEAQINDNYEIVNKICTVHIDGAEIEGYHLDNTSEGCSVWFDTLEHSIGVLTADNGATPDVSVAYSTDNGATWLDYAPAVTKPGNYTLIAKLTKNGYHEKRFSVDFQIKTAEYFVEKSDYIAGWNLILVYTNADIPGFTYEDSSMLDVSDLGYKYAASMTQTGDIQLYSYRYVFGYVVNGNANMTKVCPSNIKAVSVGGSGEQGSVSRYDVNRSGSVDINDLVAVQAIYNVDRRYMSEELLPIVLRADVNGDKKVDTSDCAAVIVNSQ